MSKNRGKSKLSKNVLFNANKHVFHCEKSLATLLYGQPSYILPKAKNVPLASFNLLVVSGQSFPEPYSDSNFLPGSHCFENIWKVRIAQYSPRNVQEY
jgi:hypothetical protein